MLGSHRPTQSFPSGIVRSVYQPQDKWPSNDCLPRSQIKSTSPNQNPIRVSQNLLNYKVKLPDVNHDRPRRNGRFDLANQARPTLWTRNPSVAKSYLSARPGLDTPEGAGLDAGEPMTIQGPTLIRTALETCVTDET